MTFVTRLAVVVVPALLAVAGCSKPAGLDAAALAEHKSNLLLAEEPDGGQTVLDVRYAIVGEPEEHDHAHDEADHEHAEDSTAAADEHEHDHAEGDHDHDHADEVADDEDDAAAADEHDHDHAEEDHDHADHDHDEAEAHDHAEHDHGAAGSDKKIEVTMVGLVGGVINPYKQSQPDFPFVKGTATIFLADPAYVAEQEAEGHQHAPGEECAFCEAHSASAADATAMVRLLDKSGKPIAADARDLVAVKPGQTVVVKGVAQVQPGGVLVVDATGIYIRE